MTLFVGVMSGTSLDGADAALVDFSQRNPRTLSFASISFTAELHDRLLALSAPGNDGLDLSGDVSIELAEVYARVVGKVLSSAGVTARDVEAIGCHGQTVRHRPERGFTIQLNDPARLAELTGIAVVADFRRRDMAAGGQGAPLAPLFHEAVFRHPSISRAVVNIGGISNITWMPVGGPTIGFDCGPGNVLLDSWVRTHLGTAYDEDGAWAARGRTSASLLEAFLAEPFLQASPPKSTGRELFRRDWLDARLAGQLEPADVQSTLADFTARSIVDALDKYCRDTQEIYLCGGGARNRGLVARIATLAGNRPVQATDALGVPAGHVESMAFAWLAMKCARREPVNVAAITGAKGARVLGAIYPA